MKFISQVKMSVIIPSFFCIAWMSITPAWALSLDALRYVFTGDKDSISVIVSNEAKRTFGGQVWVDNIVESDTRPTFVVTPSFFKLKSEKKQVLRVIKAVNLPQDKESVYWLNLQEIPPLMEGSGLSVAVRTRVKLFYRPAALLKGRKQAEEKMLLLASPDGKSLSLKNTTPYIFAINSLLNDEGVALSIPKEATNKLLMFMPGDEVTVPDTVSQVVSVNDFGELKKHALVRPASVDAQVSSLEQ
ncbi:hypothetical protein B0T45_22655 [Chromobacterium haemolyticum]|uniref:Pili assembly chaperone N-terminal domain-containing protein n=2 Tax=Chromobacterium haemolyticum TaxID=394935 RepID=A0A1W0CAC3_9NEIS|nr:hypothetical protein B0T45_22655 [Chromobacterium haemolyticum]